MLIRSLEDSLAHLRSATQDVHQRSSCSPSDALMP